MIFLALTIYICLKNCSGIVESNLLAPGEKQCPVAETSYCIHAMGDEKDRDSLIPVALEYIETLLLELHIAYG